MADIAMKGPDLKKFIKIAKKRDLNFAYCPGNDPAEDVFVLDRKKKPEAMGRVARAEGSGSKLCFGTARTKGRIVLLTCEREMPQTAKKLKKFLKFEKAPMNVIVMDKDGNILEEDIEDLPEDPELDLDDVDIEDLDDADIADDAAEEEETAAPDDGAAPAVDAARLKQLTTRAGVLQTAITGLPEQVQAPMMKRFKGVVGLLKSADLDGAEQGLDKLDAAVDLVNKKGAAQPEPDADLERLRGVAADLRQRIDAIGNPDGTARLVAAHGLLLGQIEEGDVKKATTTVKALADAIARAAEQGAASPAQEPEQAATPDDNRAQDDADDTAQDDVDPGIAWRDARADLEPVALDLLQRNLGDVSKMRAVLGFFIEKGEARDFAGAMKAEPGLKKLIAQAQAAEQTAAEKDIPAGVVPFVRARLDWVKTRTTLKAELTKLQAAIIDVCDPEEFPDIVNESKQLFGYIEALDERLEDALEALVQEPDGARRETLKADAVKVLEDYQSELDTPFFQAVDGNNGFKPVNVRGAAMESLGKVRAVLSAAA